MNYKHFLDSLGLAIQMQIIKVCAKDWCRDVPVIASMFDIFATLPDGSPLWLGAVEGLDEARHRLSGIAESRPGNYFIYSEKTGGVVERIPFASNDAPLESIRRN
jgi:hypothetical protein